MTKTILKKGTKGHPSTVSKTTLIESTTDTSTKNQDISGNNNNKPNATKNRTSLVDSSTQGPLQRYLSKFPADKRDVALAHALEYGILKLTDILEFETKEDDKEEEEKEKPFDLLPIVNAVIGDKLKQARTERSEKETFVNAKSTSKEIIEIEDKKVEIEETKTE